MAAIWNKNHLSLNDMRYINSRFTYLLTLLTSCTRVRRTDYLALTSITYLITLPDWCLQERRQTIVLYTAFGVSVLASFVWLIALSTNGWVELILPKPGVYLPSLHYDDTWGKLVLVESLWTGMWRFCRVEYTNATGNAANVASSIDSEGLYRPTLKGTQVVRTTF